MRKSGKIRSWNAEKAFGFIKPGEGGKDVFLNKSGLSNRNRLPAIGQRVTYSLSTDRQGRPCAERALLPGDRIPARKTTGGKTGAILVALAFLGFVALLASSNTLSPLILGVYLIISLVTFLVYAFDKQAAKDGAWRTSEGTLHVMSLVGGWPGALIAQQTLRHKSRKQSFRSLFWVTVFLNCCALVWMLTPEGSRVVQSWIGDGHSLVGIGQPATIEWSEPR